MSAVRLVVLGNPHAGDDGAALAAVASMEFDSDSDIQIIRAGRPGTGLLDLCGGDRPVILIDVVSGAGAAGQIMILSFDELIERLRAVRDGPTGISSHSFGPAEVLRLGEALGRPRPSGFFVGIEGTHFAPGDVRSLPVEKAMESFQAAIRAAIEQVRDS